MDIDKNDQETFTVPKSLGSKLGGVDFDTLAKKASLIDAGTRKFLGTHGHMLGGAALGGYYGYSTRPTEEDGLRSVGMGALAGGALGLLSRGKINSGLSGVSKRVQDAAKPQSTVKGPVTRSQPTNLTMPAGYEPHIDKIKGHFAESNLSPQDMHRVLGKKNPLEWAQYNKLDRGHFSDEQWKGLKNYQFSLVGRDRVKKQNQSSFGYSDGAVARENLPKQAGMLDSAIRTGATTAIKTVSPLASKTVATKTPTQKAISWFKPKAAPAQNMQT